ncbi:hypothetical protein ACFX11_038863 [Malus domestica]
MQSIIFFFQRSKDSQIIAKTKGERIYTVSSRFEVRVSVSTPRSRGLAFRSTRLSSIYEVQRRWRGGSDHGDGDYERGSNFVMLGSDLQRRWLRIKFGGEMQWFGSEFSDGGVWLRFGNEGRF